MIDGFSIYDAGYKFSLLQIIVYLDTLSQVLVSALTFCASIRVVYCALAGQRVVGRRDPFSGIRRGEGLCYVCISDL
jgi:hypothetical protein